MIRRTLAAVAALLFVAGGASAAILHIDPTNGMDGISGHDGSSHLLAWRTMHYANSQLHAGDVLYCWAATAAYDELPNPVAGGGRYTFIGAAATDPLADSTARENIKFPAGTISHANMTIKGVHFNGDMLFAETADFDTIAYNKFGTLVGSGRLIVSGSDYTIFDNNVVMGNHLCVNFGLGDNIHSDGLGFYNNQFRYLGAASFNGQHVFVTGDCDSTTWMFNTFYIDVSDALSGQYCGEWHFDDYHHFSRGNHTYCNLTRTGGYTEWRWRSNQNSNVGEVYEGCHDNTFDCDTLIYRGLETVFTPSQSSTCDASSTARFYPGCAGHWNVVMDSCYFDAHRMVGSNLIFNGAMIGWQISYTTILMNGVALESFDTRFHNVINHCTLVGNCNNTAHSGNNAGVVQFTNQWARPAFTDTAMTFTNNIVYNWGNIDYGIWWETSKVDSAGKMKQQKKLVANNNLIYTVNNNGVAGDRALFLSYALSTSKNVASAVGDSTQSRQHAENRYSIDSLSVFGSPKFDRGGPDTLLTSADFDPHIGRLGAALGRGSGGSDIGAVSYADPAEVVLSSTKVNFDRANSTDTVYVVRVNALTAASSILYFNSSELPTNVTQYVDVDPLYIDSGTQQLGGGVDEHLDINFIYHTYNHWTGNGPLTGTVYLHTDDPLQRIIPITVTVK